jgi:hypothetical protein
MQNDSLPSPNRDPGLDAAQFFQRNSPLSAFGEANNLLGNDVINIGRESILTTGQLAEFTLGTATAIALKLGAKPSVSEPNSFYGITCVASTIRVRSDIGNPKVDAKPFVHFPHVRLFHVAGYGQIPFAAMIEQVGLTLTLLELFDLARSGHVLNILPPAKSPEVDVRILAESEYSIIIGNRTSGPEDALNLLIKLVGVCNFGKYANCELGIEFVQLSCGVIKRLLEGEVGEDLDLPRLCAEPVRAVVAPSQGGK